MKKILYTLIILAAIGSAYYFYLQRKPSAPTQITPQTVLAAAKPLELSVVEQVLTVNGQTANVFNIIQLDGTEGFYGNKGDRFDVNLVNKTQVPILIHWHGLVIPNDQDGIPYVTQLPINPGETRHYNFELKQKGTYWMHSHYRYYEQLLQTAPFIIADPNEKNFYDREIVAIFQDFSFKDPRQILAELKGDKSNDTNKPSQDLPSVENTQTNEPTSNPTNPPSSNASITQAPMMTMSKRDLNDVKYDAYLANRRTLQDPAVYAVKPGENVRLRLINGSSATNFWVIPGTLESKAIATDGQDIEPITQKKYQLAVAQRIDIVVTIPPEGGVFPIFAQVEGLKNRTGIILATNTTNLPTFSEQAESIIPAVDNEQEFSSHAVDQLPDKPITKSLTYELTGDMNNYIWIMNNEAWPAINPLKIKMGDRVEMVYVNNTGMAHPMHFHGHTFKVTEINSKSVDNGPMRDTILVLPNSTAKIIFDADNPGIWMNHCHVLYHLLSGMMTTTNYEDYPEPSFYKDLLSGKIQE